MTSRPILFSAPMIRALLDGSKAQTRRAVKPGLEVLQRAFGVDDAAAVGLRSWPCRDGHAVECPYGIPGDTLWVRETWRTDVGYDVYSPLDIARDSGTRGADVPVEYVADGSRVRWTAEDKPGRTRVSIHMPRWASRITLEMTGVRVDRVQSISEADARAEGAASILVPDDDFPQRSYQLGFKALWCDINGPQSWADNPWVWCVSFRRTP